MTVTLHLGDCLEIMPTFPTQSVDAIIADLPYGTTACAWDVVIPFTPLWTEYKRIIKPLGVVVLFGGQPFTSLLVTSNLDWFKYSIVWNKQAYANFAQVPNMFGIVHEDVCIFSQAGVAQCSKSKMVFNHQEGIEINQITKYDYRPNSFIPNRKAMTRTGIKQRDKYSTSILNFGGLNGLTNQNGRLHPTQKPVALLEYLVRTYTNPGDTVMDNTMGSGTTGVACVRTGRNFIGCELDETYFKIAQRRIAEAQLQPPLIPHEAVQVTQARLDV